MVAMTVTVMAVLAAWEAQAAPREELAGGPCEGCEAVFVGRPDRLRAHARIAPIGERGEPLAIDGVVRDATGAAVAGVIVYAYHTDASGRYPASPRGTAHHHGRLRGFARTGPDGAYRFTTIRPGAYPGRDEPQHVHLHVVEPGRCTYYIDDIVFTDDPLLTAEQRRRAPGRGGLGIATPTRDRAGTWHVRRDIVLGAGVLDHAVRCR